MLLNRVCAIVDLETTGTSAARESITEVGVAILDVDGSRFELQRLVNPYRSIPPFISSLTGISNAMVENEAGFEDLAPELWSLIKDTVFIAHNARFDYSFLKAGFAHCGFDFKPNIVCTVKLARALYPQWQGYSLGKIIERIGHKPGARHRAMADVESTEAFLNYAIEEHGLDTVNKAASVQLKNASVPCHLDPADIAALPEEPGVYYFYGENASLLYVGKSKSIRTRVRSHFSSDIRESREMRMAQEIRSVEHRCSAGELGALLLENHEIKNLQPIYNRRQRPMKKLWSVHLDANDAGYYKAVVAQHEASKIGQMTCYGIFSSKRTANKMLEELSSDDQLCKKLLGLEKGPGACFGFQLKKCNGACTGSESFADHNAKLKLALDKKRIDAWPYDSRIAVIERHKTKAFVDAHIIDNWAYRGSWRVANPSELMVDELDEDIINSSGVQLTSISLGFDKDTYMLLQRHLIREPSPDLSIVQLRPIEAELEKA
ncbi:MAG: exonuclease domain-containing protein [Pseudomonadales bacterium]